MATRLVERPIRVGAGAARQQFDVSLPAGALVLAILQHDNSGSVLLKVDPALPLGPRRFAVVLGEEDVNGTLLTAAEVAGTYLGSFWAYARNRGQRRDLHHVFEVVAS